MSDLTNVLVVDDDLANLKNLVELLGNQGYTPHPAKDGSIAWALLEKNPLRYQAVLLDWVMPKMNGMEVLKSIKSHGVMNMLPVIMQTAKSASDEVLEGLQAGAYYYITKPYSLNNLFAIVKTAVADYNKYVVLKEKASKATASFSLMSKGSYFFRTLEEADTLATIVVSICPNPEEVVLGLSELLVNAVEHGNLGITYEEKSSFVENGMWASEVERRLTLPEYRSKTATLEVERKNSELHFTITDEGGGFDWNQYLEISPERAFDTHGRGIAMARELSFKYIEYIGKGNKVLAVARK